MLTGGIDFALVEPVLESRIGWESEAGTVRKFKSFHQLCTEVNLREVQPTPNITDADFTTYKAGLKTEAIQRCLTSVFSEPEYIEQVLLHRRIPDTVNQVIEPAGRFQCIRINVAPERDITQLLKRVTLLFDEDAQFDLKLYADGNATALKTQTVMAVGGQPTQVDLTDMVLSYAKYGVTTFYLGYNEDDLGVAKAIREQVRANLTKTFAATAASIEGSFTGTKPVAYTDSNGLNLEVHAQRDYTYLILRSPQLFDEVLGLSMVYQVLEIILSTMRTNGTERALRGGYDDLMLHQYLYGATPAQGFAKTKGLNDLLSEKLQAVRNHFYPKPKNRTVSLC